MTLGLYIAAWVAGGFLAGSIPFGYIIARVKGLDIRQVGSGNIGMTNVARALGWGFASIVLILDVLKGLLPVLGFQLWSRALPPGAMAAASIPWYTILIGMAAILGHTFTPWLGFRGGKGVATGLGVILAVMQWWALAPLAAFLLIVGTTRTVSLGSLFAALLVSATIITVPGLRPYWLLGVLVPVLVIYTHRSNIQRILDGTESKITLAKKGQPPDSTSAPSKE